MNKQDAGFAQRLIAFRKAIELTKADTSKKIGVMASGYQRWECGFLPNGQSLKKMHEKLGVNIHWLLTGDGHPFAIKNEQKIHQHVIKSLASIEQDIRSLKSLIGINE